MGQEENGETDSFTMSKKTQILDITSATIATLYWERIVNLNSVKEGICIYMYTFISDNSVMFLCL